MLAVKIGGGLARKGKFVGAGIFVVAFAINRGYIANCCREWELFKGIEEVTGLKVENY